MGIELRLTEKILAAQLATPSNNGETQAARDLKIVALQEKIKQLNASISYDTNFNQFDDKAQQVASTIASTIGNAVTGITDGIAGWIYGTKIYLKSLANIGQGVLRTMLQTLVQIGAQWLVNVLMDEQRICAPNAGKFRRVFPTDYRQRNAPAVVRFIFRIVPRKASCMVAA